MNQVTQNIPTTLTDCKSDLRKEIDCSPPRDTQFEVLALEIERLRIESERLAQQNEGLKQVIDSVYASPTEKRTLISQLEKKYGISRRRACRLLTFARSTCWYRSAEGRGISSENKTAISTLSNSALVQRLKKLTRQAENGFLPLDENLQSQFEYGLNKIGLASAAHLSQSNLKLAMEIFSAWCEQARK